MNNEQFYDLLNKLAESESHAELKGYCDEFSVLLDVPYFLLGIIGQESAYAPSIRVLSNYPQQWLNLYFEESKQKEDPVVKYILEKQVPIRWDKLAQIEGFSSSKNLKVFKDAAIYGLSNGVSIPLNSVGDNIAVFSIAINERDNKNVILDNALLYAHTFATSLLERYLLIELNEAQEQTQVRLTKRELECLFWATEGKTAWEISQILNVSERTAIFHLNNSSHKLGANNRQHAVALAIKKGLIRPNI